MDTRLGREVTNVQQELALESVYGAC